MGEMRTLRGRVQDDRDGSDPVPDGRDAPASFVGVVYDGGAMPAGAPGRYLVHPASVACADAEGSPAAASAATRSRVVTILGPGTPSVGDVVVADLVDGYWVGRKRRSRPTYPPGYVKPTHFIPGCPCHALPDQIAVTISPVLAYFQNSIVSWGPIPGDISSYLGWGAGSAFNPGYSSPKMTNPTDGSTFRYVFYCDHTGFYRLDALVTSDSPVNFPGPANIAQALAGLPGNTCGPPFALHSMSVFLRGETVTMDGV